MSIIAQKYSKNRQKGNIAEDIACLFLMKRGFTLVERNYLKSWGEIDIVAEKSKRLHFIEIKSVSCEINHQSVPRETISRPVTHETIRPEENMTEDKTHRLGNVIKTYLSERKVSGETLCQVDLMTVKFDQNSKIALVESFEKVI